MLYDEHFKDTLGNDISLKNYEGKVILIVNTATKCGLSSQFEGLEQLHQTYKDKGLVVLGFPCNQFLRQEPETNETVVSACLLNFGVTFLLSEKIEVLGKKAHPIFKLLKEALPGSVGTAIKWNFTKFLVAKDGTPYKRYAPTDKPESLEADIKKLLNS